MEMDNKNEAYNYINVTQQTILSFPNGEEFKVYQDGSGEIILKSHKDIGSHNLVIIPIASNCISTKNGSD